MAEGASHAVVGRPTRLFWAVLAVIVLISAIPRLLTFRFSLPYIDHPDEPNTYLAAMTIRGKIENPEALPPEGRPPIYLYISALAQMAVESFGSGTISEGIGLLRLISAKFNLATIVFIALTARLAAGDWAGWIAGLAWGISPYVLERGIYATRDPMVYMLTALALWLASVAALDERRKHWSVWSVVAGLACLASKYHPASAVLPGMIVALIYLIRDPRRNYRYLAIQLGLTAVVAPWMLYRISIAWNFGREAGTARAEGLRNLLTPERLFERLQYTVLPLGSAVFPVLIGLGALAFLLALKLKRPRVRIEPIGLAALLAITVPWLATAYRDASIQNLRDVLPATAVCCVLMGAAVVQIANLAPERFRMAALAVLTVGLAALVFIPQVQADLGIVEDRMLPDRRVELREWFDVNLEPGTIIVTAENHKTFNPGFGGIPYRRWFDWWRSDDITEHTVAEWRDERGMSYAVLPTWQVEAMERTPEGRAYLAEMLRLRDFVAPPRMRGPEMIVYRLWRMQVETDVRFGDAITLVGYDLGEGEIMPGGQITFRFYWNASRTPERNYSLFVHLMPADEIDLLAQADGNPAMPERLTMTWDEPSEVLISPPFTLDVPEELPDGEYRVLIGLYDFESGERLPVTDGTTGESLGDSYEILRFTTGGD